MARPRPVAPAIWYKPRGVRGLMPFSRGTLLALAGLMLAGTVGRIVWAHASVGVLYDVVSLETVARELATTPRDLYGTGRWPYPGGFFGFVALANAIAEAPGDAFRTVIQLPAILADAALAYLVALALHWRGATTRLVVAGAALVALSPSFAVISGYHSQIDSVAVLPALAGVLAWARNVPHRALVAGLLIGVAASIKQPPGFMVLALLPTVTSRREALTLVAAAVAVPLASILPWLLLEPRLTIDGLTANKGVPGFAGLSAFVQPDLTRAWATLEGNIAPSEAIKALTDVQNVIVAVAALATGALLYVRRATPLVAATVIWLVVYAVNPNFTFQYLVWGLPFFLAAGYLREVALFTVIATAAAFLLYFRPDLNDDGWTYYVLAQAVWLTLVATAVRWLIRVMRGDAPRLTLQA